MIDLLQIQLIGKIQLDQVFGNLKINHDPFEGKVFVQCPHCMKWEFSFDSNECMAGTCGYTACDKKEAGVSVYDIIAHFKECTRDRAILWVAGCMEIMPEMKLGKYRHFKGQDYLVVGIDIDSTSRELRVEYYPLYGTYMKNSKPMHEFIEIVTKGEYTGPRYAYITEE